MNKWLLYSQIGYYTGAGVVLLGTGLRYLYFLLRQRAEEAKMVKELREYHLPNIYGALSQIAEKLNIQLNITPRL